jgi:hypothetical protein
VRPPATDHSAAVPSIIAHLPRSILARSAIDGEECEPGMSN